jgi:hypothetical protein
VRTQMHKVLLKNMMEGGGGEVHSGDQHKDRIITLNQVSS